MNKNAKIFLQDAIGVFVALGFFLHVYNSTICLVLLLLWLLLFFWVKKKPVPEKGWVRWVWAANHFTMIFFLISVEVFLFVYMVISLMVDILVWNATKTSVEKGDSSA